MSAKGTVRPDTLLFVDDFDLARRTVSRTLSHVLPVVMANGHDNAIVMMRERAPIAGAIIDVNLGSTGGDGFDVAEHLAELQPDATVLMISDSFERTYALRAQELGAAFVDRTDFSRTLYCFVARLLCRSLIHDVVLRSVVRRAAWKLPLTYRELQILVFGTADLSRDEMADALGIARETLKTEVRGLIGKAKAESLGDLVLELRSRARSLR